MGYVETNTKTFIASGALGQFLRVKDNGSDKLQLAGLTDGPDVELGTLETAALAADEAVAVRLRTASGTRQVVAAAAITAFAPVYTAANGKVSVSASTGYLWGIALEHASNDGDIIEVMPVWPMVAVS